MGSLHEANPSLWVGTTEAPRFHELHGDMEADVAVVGAGIAGLTAAALLKRDGRRVVVIEAGPVAAGVSAYTTAKLTVLHGLVYDQLSQAFGPQGAKHYAEANLVGMATVAALVERHGIECDLERRPAYTYTVDPGKVDAITAEVRAAQEIGLVAEFTTDTDLPYAVEAAIRIEDQAQFHPRKYCLGLARAVDGGGSNVFERTPRLVGRRRGRPLYGGDGPRDRDGPVRHPGHVAAVLGLGRVLRPDLPEPQLRHERPPRRPGPAGHVPVGRLAYPVGPLGPDGRRGGGHPRR